MDDRNLYGKAIDPDKRGRHATFDSAVDAALAGILTEHDPFFDSLVDAWEGLFPGLPARPGRLENGCVYLYVDNAPTSFAVRPRLKAVAARLAQLPNAPKRLALRLEIHAR